MESSVPSLSELITVANKKRSLEFEEVPHKRAKTTASSLSRISKSDRVEPCNQKDTQTLFIDELRKENGSLRLKVARYERLLNIAPVCIRNFRAKMLREVEVWKKKYAELEEKVNKSHNPAQEQIPDLVNISNDSQVEDDAEDTSSFNLSSLPDSPNIGVVEVL